MNKIQMITLNRISFFLSQLISFTLTSAEACFHLALASSAQVPSPMWLSRDQGRCHLGGCLLPLSFFSLKKWGERGAAHCLWEPLSP